MEHRPARLPSFTAGLAATLVFLGAADGLARLLGASTSPLTAVGLLVIRVLPTDLVTLAIALFGEADKLVLILTVGAAGLVIGGLVTLLLRSRPRTALLTLTAGVRGRRQVRVWLWIHSCVIGTTQARPGPRRLTRVQTKGDE